MANWLNAFTGGGEGAAAGSEFGPLGSVIGGVGGLLGGLFGGDDSDEAAKRAQEILSQIPGTMKPYYQPYMEAGQASLGDLRDILPQLLHDPGSFLNQMGEHFHQSPGYQFAYQQAMNAAKRMGGAQGMVGSPQQTQMAEQLATGLGNQEYYKWMDQAQNLFGQGLGAEQHLTDVGYNASNTLAQALAQAMMSQAGLQYSQGQNKFQENQGMFGNLLGAAQTYGDFQHQGLQNDYLRQLLQQQGNQSNLGEAA